MEGTEDDGQGYGILDVKLAETEEDERIASLRNHIEDLLERNLKSQKDFDALKSKYESREKELSASNGQKYDALAKVAELTALLHQRDDAVKNLKTDVDMLGAQLAEASRAKNNALLKLDNISSREESLENRKRMMEQEMELLRGQIRSYEQRVERQEAELVDATSTSRVVQLESQLQRLIDELAARDQTAGRLRNQLKEEQQKISKLEERLELTRLKEEQMQIIHKKELEAQMNVSRIAEEKFKESEAMLQQYLLKIKEIQTELDIKSIPGDAERKALEEINRLKSELGARDAKILDLDTSVATLERELQNIKKENVEQYMQKLFPSASVVSQHLQGDLSLTEIYKRYSNTVEELNKTKYERDLLDVKLKGSIEELNVNAEAMSKCQSRLTEVEQLVQKLTTENQRLSVEYENKKLAAKESARSANQHAVDKGRLKLQNDDLRKQVIRLVQEIAVLKSGNPENMSDEDQLVLFRSVEELQHKNIELLSLVRELQIKTENAEKAYAEVEKVASCNERLEELVEQVKRYEERDTAKSEMVKLLIRQRDHFEEMSQMAIRNAEEKVQEMRKSMTPVKSVQDMDVDSSAPSPSSEESQPVNSQPESRVLSPRTPAPVQRQPFYQQRSMSLNSQQRMNRPQMGSPRFSPYNTPPAPSRAYLDGLQARLKKCQEELDSTTKNFAEYRENSKKNMDMVIDDMEKMRSDLHDVKLEKANLRAMFDTSKDKLASMKNIMDGQQRQLDAVQRMRDIQDQIIRKHEKSVVELNKEIVTTYAKLSSTEGLLERANAEIRRLRVSETSARTECESLRASTANQNLVYLGAQELKACRQRAEAEDSLILSNQLQAVQNENRDLKQRLETGHVHLNDEINNLKACLNRDQALLQGALAEKASAQAECARATELLAQAQRDVLVLRTNKNPTVAAEAQTDAELDLTEKVATLEEHLNLAEEGKRTAEAEIVDLTGKLASAMDALAQTQKLCNELQQKCNAVHDLAEEDKNAAKQKLHALEGELSVAREELSVAKEQLCRAEKQIETLRAELVEASRQHAIATVGLETEEAINKVTNELAALKEKQERCEETLEREKEQHKLDLQALAITRKQLVASEKSVLELKERILCLEGEVQMAKNSFENAKSMASVVSGDRSDLVQELKAHNAVLHEQLQQFMQQSAGHPLNLSGSFSEEDTPEPLVQVMKHLRRERDMAQSKADALEAKAANLRLQIDTLERKLEEANEDMKRKREEETGQLMTSIPQSRYEELLRQSDTLNALTDSSIVQRQKNDALSKENAELKPKLKAAQEEIESLKNRNNLFQEKIVAEEENSKELLEKHRLETNRANLAESKLRELEQKLNTSGSSQQNMTAEISNLKGRITNLAQEMQKKIVENKKVSLERDNLQKQLDAEKSSASKIAQELAQEKTNVTSKSAEVEQLKKSLDESKKEASAKVIEVTATATKIKEALTNKEKEFEDLNNKHCKVRAIAKKYKDQYDALAADSKSKADAVALTGAQEQAKIQEMEAKVAEMQTRLAEAETKSTETESELQKLNESLEVMTKQLEEKATLLEQEQKTSSERQNRIKTVIAQARTKIKEQADLLAKKEAAIKENLEKIKEMESVVQAASNEESVISQLRKENAELKALMEQTKQESKASKPTAGPSGTTPSVKIRPMASQAPKVKPQTSVAVIPTTRAAPTARLRPMVNTPVRNVAVLAPSPQDLPSTSVTPIQGTPRSQPSVIRVAPREEHSSDSSTSLDETGAPSTSTNVLLVRPNEVHPPVYGTQPSTSSGPVRLSLSLKRSREPETATAAPEEPQAKHLHTESSEEVEEASVDQEEQEEVVEEPSANAGGTEAEESEEAINDELEEMALQAEEDEDEQEEPLVDDIEVQQELAEEPEEAAEDEEAQAEEAGESDGGAAQASADTERPLQIDLVPQAAQARANFMLLQSNAGGPLDSEESAGGHTVPGTPIAISPDDVVPNMPSESQASDEMDAGSLDSQNSQHGASSSSNDARAPVDPPLGTPHMQRSIPRGNFNSLRTPMSTGRGASRVARPPMSARPAPIVWDREFPERGGRGAHRASGIGAQRSRGRGRARGGNPFQRGR
ncbi:nucleoprotein TPR-like isoform X2 [Neocloeon triangulifer]|uniref:nucleoprotein TPR-like isoform X2 n=1 Tax=Neocloeon triangulifer TaxID=2078957 RepID=UPI00286F2D45|nr:nucleoprotein TPR-like isoform X2 [Neocloeon triangulifer]